MRVAPEAMTELVGWVQGWPNGWPLLVLLAVAGLLHGLALWRAGVWPTGLPAADEPRPAAVRWLGGLAQVVLLMVLVGLGWRTLSTNEPGGWLPLRSDQTLLLAGWLALGLYLIAGFWWRSLGLGVSLPLLLLAVVSLPDLTPDGVVTRGLVILPAGRPVYGLLSAVTLALALLAVAGLAAVELERRRLGRPLLANRAVVGLLGGAALLQTLQLGLVIAGWLTRGRLSTWTLPDTWLAGSWLVLLLAVVTAGQPSRARALVAGLALLLLLGLIVVGAATTRL